MAKNNTTVAPQVIPSPSCSAVGYQRAAVCVPVEVKPFAVSGEVVTTCCGSPIVTAGENICEGEIDGSCFFTISQVICVEVPMQFGAETIIGGTYVNCIEIADYNVCTDCNPEIVNM